MKNVILVAFTLFIAARISGQTLQDAQREMDNESYFKAKHVLFKLLNDGTSNKSEISYYLGNAYLKSDDADSATMFYKMVNDPDSKYALNYVAKGRISLLQKNKVDAKLNFDKALQYSKFKNANIYFEIGDAYFRPNIIDLAEAIKNLEAALGLDNKNTSVMLELGDAYLENSASDPTMGGKAMTQYQNARGVNKNLSIAWIKEGRLDVRGQIYDQAIDAFNKALGIDQNYPIVHKELGEAYYLTKNYDKMISEFQKYIDLSPGDTKARVGLLEMLFRNKAYDRVVDEANKGLKNDPSNMDYLRFLIYANYELKRYKDGADAANSIFALPNFKPKPRDYIYAARLAAATGDTTRAMNYFKVALANDSSNCDLIGEYAKVLYLAKHYDESIKEYLVKKQVCTDKYGAIDMYYVGRAYLILDDSLDADSTFADFINKSPTTPDGYYWRARTNLKIGKLEDFYSFPYYQKYIEIVEPLAAANPAKYKSNMIEAYDYIGLYYADKGKDKAKAKEYLQKALELDPNDENTLEFMKQLK